MRIAVLGANGVYGRHLVPRLVAAGHEVRALVRRPEAAGFARACGAEIAVADIFDEQSLVAALEGCEAGVNVATSLPGPSGRGDYEANDRLRRDGTPGWLRACREAGVGRVVQQSIAMVSAAGGDAWSDEDTAAPPFGDELLDRAIGAARAMEESVLESDLDAVILRGGLFYGPGTGFDDEWFSRAKAGKLRLPGDGASYVSLVHIADMARATVAAIERSLRERILIVADDRPVTWLELFTYVAEAAGAAPPLAGGRMGFPSFRVRNLRAKEALGWTPLYRDFRAGLAR
jgi:nucleoside-diphosphate-sugar epimerase